MNGRTDPINRLRLGLAAGGSGPSSDFDFDRNELMRPKAFRPAAVLIAVAPGCNGASVVLTRRSERLKSHAGQIALPGGKAEKTDGSAAATALRESAEEIGLRATQARIIGQLPVHHTVTGFAITPVVGIIDPDFRPVPDRTEVAEIFPVPLDFLLDQENYAIRSRRWNGVTRHFPVIPFGPYYVWGATARILLGLARVCR
jgi:8-oxo-dGTP pyrophosphatase MutT (NUDIX family)